MIYSYPCRHKKVFKIFFLRLQSVITHLNNLYTLFTLIILTIIPKCLHHFITAEVVGEGKAGSENGAKSIGENTVTNTGSDTYTVGVTGIDGDHPAVGSRTKGEAGAIAEGEGATEAETKTGSEAIIKDAWSFRSAFGGSKNKASSSGNFL